MTNEELQKSWAVTLRHLAASRYHLPERLEGEALGAASHFDHLFHHNEFGLALEEAEALGKLAESNACYWEELRLAAENIGMDEAAAKFARRVAGMAQAPIGQKPPLDSEVQSLETRHSARCSPAEFPFSFSD